MGRISQFACIATALTVIMGIQGRIAGKQSVNRLLKKQKSPQLPFDKRYVAEYEPIFFRIK
jgi:hypothetical protein